MNGQARRQLSPPETAIIRQQTTEPESWLLSDPTHMPHHPFIWGRKQVQFKKHCTCRSKRRFTKYRNQINLHTVILHVAMYRVIVVIKACRVLRRGGMEGSWSLGQPTRGGPPVWGLGEVLMTHQRKKSPCYKTLTNASDLDWLFDDWDGCGGLVWLGSQLGQVAGSCEGGNEPSVSIKCKQFIDYLRTC
jgi:hypothetical protein